MLWWITMMESHFTGPRKWRLFLRKDKGTLRHFTHTGTQRWCGAERGVLYWWEGSEVLAPSLFPWSPFLALREPVFLCSCKGQGRMRRGLCCEGPRADSTACPSSQSPNTLQEDTCSQLWGPSICPHNFPSSTPKVWPIWIGRQKMYKLVHLPQASWLVEVREFIPGKQITRKQRWSGGDPQGRLYYTDLQAVLSKKTPKVRLRTWRSPIRPDWGYRLSVTNPPSHLINPEILTQHCTPVSVS